MTKQDFTSINVIMDASGSMAGLVSDTVGGFNKFLEDQKVVPGEVVLTLCTFNTTCKMVHDFEKLNDIPDLSNKTYKPNGGTALLDAMGLTINRVGDKLSAMPEEERPSKVLFLIITDGQENSSKRFSKTQIKDMVAHQQDVYSWEFMFYGADLKQISEAQDISLRNSTIYLHDKDGIKNLYNSISRSTNAI